MTESQTGPAIPYTAYKSKRHSSTNIQNANAPPSRPSSFSARAPGSDIWDKAQGVFGEIVRGGEEMVDEIFGGTSPPGYVHDQALQQQRIPTFASSPPRQVNGVATPTTSPPISQPISPSLKQQTTFSPPQQPAPLPVVVVENGLPSPPESEPDADGEYESKKADGGQAIGSEEESREDNIGQSSSETTVTLEDSRSLPGSIPASPTRSVHSVSSADAGPSTSPAARISPRTKTSSFRHVPRSSPLNPNVGHSRTTSTSSLKPVLPSTSSSNSIPTRQNRHSSLGIPGMSMSAAGSRMSSFTGSMTSTTSSAASPSTSPGTTSIMHHIPPRRTDSLQAPTVWHTTSSNSVSTMETSGSSLPSRHASPSPGPSKRDTSSPPSVSRATSPTAGDRISNTVTSPNRSSSTITASAKAPYRPGFQPKGLYRPWTDEFMELRKQFRDGSASPSISNPNAASEGGGWATQLSRVERTKLERRLEKLIALHFPVQSASTPTTSPPKERKRNSSFFGSLSSSLSSSLGVSSESSLSKEPTKAELRAAEQRITPWEDDGAAKGCWVCSTSFHPLTNRKHHCRLCGHIVCALPISNKLVAPPPTESEPNPTPAPVRPVKCSTLFIVDKNGDGKRRIEEVGEGVDYGVKKHRVSASGTQHPAPDLDDDKFLKGVRICRACRPVLLRAQYSFEMAAGAGEDLRRLYDTMLDLEKEIEEGLPAFHELVLTLNDNSLDAPPPEMTMMRKRLLESFTQYDAIAKKIRSLPTSSTPKKKGSPPTSQERVQSAIMMRASLFIEKNMYPLKRSISSSKPATPSGSPGKHTKKLSTSKSKEKINKEKKVHEKLQPLLEQESLLESFVQEAQAGRKFEDVKTLRVNLGEIQSEIARVMKEEGVNQR